VLFRSVHTAGVESEGPEATLEFSHVVTALHRDPVVEHPGSERVAGLDQRLPRGVVTDAIGGKAPRRLERPLCVFGCGRETTRVASTRVVSGDHEPPVKVTNGLPGGPQREGELAQRNSPSSWSSWPLPLAPTIRFAA
jgi:hypothetical protein